MIKVSCDSIPNSGEDIDDIGREDRSGPVEVEARDVVDNREVEDGRERAGDELTLSREEGTRDRCINSGDPFSEFDRPRL